MSLLCFDKAMDEYLKNVFPTVRMLHTQEGLVAYAGDTQKDSVLSNTDDADMRLNTDEDVSSNMVPVPMITFYRMNNPLNLEEMGQYAMTNRGRFYPDEKRRIKSFPIKINYQIDIWSDRRVEVDNIWRELIQFIHENKYLRVEFDGIDLLQDYTLNLVNTDTTTDIGSFDSIGRLHRETLDIEIPQAEMLFEEGVDLVKKIPVRYISIRDLTEDEKGDTNYFEISSDKYI